jgi:amino acid adenylation domain-containing protein
MEAEGPADGLGPVTTLYELGTGHGLDAWLGDEPDSVPPPIGSDTTAAILYTSGSTGTPKGVMLSHANVSSFVGWAIDRFALGPDDRFASHAPFHFDLSTLDLFAPLILGASVFLLDETAVRFPAVVAKTLERERVSVWYSVPTALRLLIEHGGLDRRDLGALRLVLFAGEVFPVPALRRLMAAVPHPRYANLYGPTETNVCTYYVVPDPLPAGLTVLPVGVPCEHVQVTIAGGAGQPVPPGEAGEICVEGPAVMQGYWRQPEASRAARAGGREGSYRTGDFGAWQADGTIRFLGRRDHQVKIRGHRVDLLDIEHWLAVHSRVGQAAAVVVAPGSLEARIVAFATPSGRDRPTPESLRRHCARVLPAHAVPSRVVVRETLPRTSTGKLDRRRLGEWAAEALAGPLPAREARS